MSREQRLADKSTRCCGTRREFLWELGAGFGGLALTSLLDGDGFFARPAVASEPGQNSSIAAKPSVLFPKAKSCIFLFLYGGPSQVDSWDYKPELQKRHGQQIRTEFRAREFRTENILALPHAFSQCGQSGLWCSDMFPHIARQMDEVCVVKSMYTDTFAHGSALLQMNTGRFLQGGPAMGSWVNYGLGSMNQNLPGFVVMVDPRGGPINGSANWSSGFMPASYQGTTLRSRGEPVLDLTSKSGMSPEVQRDAFRTLHSLNAAHLQDHPGYSELNARIASYELAAQLQTAAPEALDLTQEDTNTQKMYGLFDGKPDAKNGLGPEPFGRQCLIARRLVERGVRFVQIYSGGGVQQSCWDAHEGMEVNIQLHAPEIDKPIAALLVDLKQRGLLDETLVVWGGEFGRLPFSPDESLGRDHNPKGFTYCLAGGGIKKGFSFGETDELGSTAVVDRCHIRDLHATILHLMGLDHRKLSFFYGGLEQKLTGVQRARVIDSIIA